MRLSSLRPPSSALRPLASALLLALPALAFAQGSLTPPDAPAPTMKTLDQIEPRRVIGTPGATRTTGYIISTPGSYVLAGPIAVATGNAITISANNVTLDLNGFELSSAANPKSGTAIAITAGCSGIAIANGFITNFAGGIVSDGTTSHSLHVADVTVTAAGVDGIVLARRDAAYNLPALDTGIDRCSASVGTGIGLSANRIALSQADSDGPRAIQAGTVSASHATGATGYAIDAHTADSCYAMANNAIALGAANGCTATNCYAFSYFTYGLDALNATGCYAGSQTGYGARIYFTATGCYAETQSGLVALTAAEAAACAAVHKATYGTRYALYSSGTTSFCYARVGGTGASGTPVALTAAIAIGCIADGVANTDVPAGKKFLGTP